jgi:hypothetical protein
MTMRRWMIAIAVAALVSLVVSNPYRHDGITDNRVVIPVASGVAAVYGVGAMRRPLMFLLPLLIVWIATPAVDHPHLDVINVSVCGCYLAWIIGAPAGWMSRHITGRAGGRAACRPNRPRDTIQRTDVQSFLRKA